METKMEEGDRRQLHMRQEKAALCAPDITSRG